MHNMHNMTLFTIAEGYVKKYVYIYAQYAQYVINQYAKYVNICVE